MLYYIQLFNIKNYKKNIYHTVNTNVFTIWNDNYTNTRTTFLYTHYYLLFCIISFLGFLFLTFFFYTDLFLIFSL